MLVRRLGLENEQSEINQHFHVSSQDFGPKLYPTKIHRKCRKVKMFWKYTNKSKFESTLTNKLRACEIRWTLPKFKIFYLSTSHLKHINWILYPFFWVIPRRLNFMCWRFGTLCPFHLHWRLQNTAKVWNLEYKFKLAKVQLHFTSQWMWNTASREKAHLMVFGKRMPKTVLGSRRGKTGLRGAGKLRREESNNLCSSQSILKAMT